MTVQEAISYLTDSRFDSIRPGLDRTLELCERVGNPEKHIKFVHVAGSNGKGSTCVMIESVLREAGYRTGFYLSPAVESFNETYQVCGRSISDEDLASVTEEIKTASDAMDDHPSKFEMQTVAAFLYFKKMNCDIAVLETGMGGALDSTNVIPAPEAAALVNIGLEHTDFLGKTLTEIATAKAGIIKRGSDVICYRNVPEVMDVIKKTCAEKGCALCITDPEKEIRPVSKSLEGQTFEWLLNEVRESDMQISDGWHAAMTITMPLLGSHQLKNAAVALNTLHSLCKRGYDIKSEDIVSGFKKLKWPVRFEVISSNPVFIIDCAHNPQCVEALSGMIREYLPDEKITLLMGVLADKDYNQMIEMLKPFAAEWVCITPDSPRALKADQLAEVLKAQGQEAHAYETIEDAVAACIHSGRSTVSCTSLYISGKVRKISREMLKV